MFRCRIKICCIGSNIKHREISSIRSNHIRVFHLIAIGINDHNSKHPLKHTQVIHKINIVNGLIGNDLRALDIGQIDNLISANQIDISVFVADNLNIGAVLSNSASACSPSEATATS